MERALSQDYDIRSRMFVHTSGGADSCRDVTFLAGRGPLQVASVVLGCLLLLACDRNPRRTPAPMDDASALPSDADAAVGAPETIIVTESAPADAASRFEQATGLSSGTPELVYPTSGAVIPPNLNTMEFHFRPSGYDTFELRVATPTQAFRIYLGCPEVVGDGCVYSPTAEVWDQLANAARAAGPIEISIRGLRGTTVSEPMGQPIEFVEEDISGGLYYWNAGAGQIMRYEWGRRQGDAEVYLDQNRTGATLCVGCHSVSRDGTRIAVGVDLPGSILQTYDVASRERIFSRGMGSLIPNPQQPTFFSFSPDSLRLVGGAGRQLDIFDANSGEIVAERIAMNATMPDWSPGGEQIVYVQTASPPPFNTAGVASGSISTLTRADNEWSSGPVLVQRNQENNYYPAFSPDGEWVVFSRSPSNLNSMGDDDENMIARVSDAQLWVVQSDGSGEPIRLLPTEGFSESWAKWDPTAYQSRGQPLFWLSFASRRAYGLRLAQDERSQLWMAAFRPRNARQGLAAASPAIRIPFQDLETANHLPQWVTTVARPTCVNDSDCGGEFCQDGLCYPNLI